MDIRILPSQPTEYMSKRSYWDMSRFIDEPLMLPGHSSDDAYRQIFSTFNLLQSQNVQPEVIADGQELPRIRAGEGLLRLVIDEFIWEKTKKSIRSFTKLPARGDAVTAMQFNAISQQIEQPILYKGPAVSFAKIYEQQGQAYREQISRSVVYVSADTQYDGWFGGVRSYGLRYTGILQKIMIITRDYQDYIYSKKVGDINAYDSDDAPLYGVTKGVHQVIMRSKVAAAAVYKLKN